MSGVMTGGVSHAHIFMEDWQLPFYVAAGITEADVGKAVSLDTSAAYTVKLATNDEEILGRLEVYEDRKSEGIRIGTVAVKSCVKLPCVSGAVPAIGAQLVGSATPGLVKAAGTTSPGRPSVVVDRNTTDNTVLAILR